MESTSSEKNYLKKAQDILRKTVYEEVALDSPRYLEVENMTASLLNIVQYIKLIRELKEDE